MSHHGDREDEATLAHRGDVAHPGDVAHEAAAHHEHDKHAGHDPDVFRRRFWLTLVLTVPIVVFSETAQELLGFDLPDFTGDGLIAPVLGTFVFVYGGRVFLEGAWQELRQRRPGMMLLIALAITVAFVASVASLAGLIEIELWWELSTLIAIMLLGHWQEMRAIGQARGALAALAELLPDDAERVTESGVETVPISALAPGDLVLVRPGARVPADGRIEEGRAELDESMVTGESRPVAKDEGDRVVAGTVAVGSAIRVRVEAVGEETALAGIQRLVAEAQQSRSRTQVLADRFAGGLFYVAVAAGAITFVVWAVIVGDADFGVARTVTVLVIACPHALGLAIPLVVAISTSLSSRQGVLVKDRLALERMRTVDTVLFDKTGTLTRGRHAVADVASVDGDGEAVLALAAAAEADSEHPVARAIVAAASQRGSVPRASEFRAIPGRGVEATVDGARVAVGGPALLRERGAETPPVLRERTEAWEERGAAVLHVLRDDTVVGALALEDEIRPESREAVNELHELGFRVVMITGDARQVADAVARDLGIDEVFAEVLPEDKDKAVAELQERGERVAMVGDGVNDAPALARADVGIAIGAGTDVAIESAGVVLASNDPRAVVSIIRLSRASYRKMLQNLGWAAGYNVVALPLAAGVLEPVGIVLAPAVGAVLMSASTIIVALNSQLLRRIDLRPEAARP
ncbi:MAG TPA: heavy metal translocating P-type ATPase [Candidatus Limnocylindrales bacterium]|nr:heavy metal translocating P-type ATPase [Candidatus Limnocylindrales bacterium]